MKDIMTVDEVRDLLRISRTTIYKLINAKMIAVTRIGRNIRITKEALENYLKENTHG